VDLVGGLQQISVGDEVHVEIPEETIHLFDGTTGDAVHNREIDE
jgi:multiple sugar transport system ATP-binding protein